VPAGKGEQVFLLKESLEVQDSNPMHLKTSPPPEIGEKGNNQNGSNKRAKRNDGAHRNPKQIKKTMKLSRKCRKVVEEHERTKQKQKLNRRNPRLLARRCAGEKKTCPRKNPKRRGRIAAGG